MKSPLPYTFANKSPSEVTATKRVDADRIMAMFDTIIELISTPGQSGANADDSNATNGASVVAQANLTIKTSEGDTGVLDENDWVWITDGTNEWFLQNTVGDDELSFNDTHLCEGAGPADYSNSAFIDSLVFKFMPFVDKRGKSGLILDGTHADGFTADDLEISAADSTKIGTDYAAKAAIVDAVTSGSGASAVIANEKVKAASIDKTTAFADDSPINLSRGMFDNALYANDLLYGLVKTPAPANTYAVEETIVKSGSLSQEWGSNGSAQGVEIQLDLRIDPALLSDKNMTLSAWVYSTEDDALEIGFYDDVDGYQVTAQTYTKDSWNLVTVTKTIGSAVTDVRAVVRSENATVTTHYLDIAGIFIGDTSFDPTSPSMSAAIVNDALSSARYNYIFNGGFASDSWLDGTSAYPLGYAGSATAEFENSVVNYVYEDGSCSLSLAAAEDFYQIIGFITGGAAPEPAVQELLGKNVTASAKLKRNGVGNTTNITLLIEEFIGIAWSTVAEETFEVNEYDTFAQIACSGMVATNAEVVRVRLLNDSGSKIDLFVDGLMLTRTAYPIDYTVETPWKRVEKTFTMSGSLSDGIMDCGTLTEPQPTMTSALIVGLKVYCGTTGTGTDLFYPRLVVTGGGTDDITELTVSLGNGVNNGSTGDHIEIRDDDDMLTVYCDADAFNAGSDAIATVLMITWGR